MNLKLISPLFLIIIFTTISCGSGENDAGYVTYDLGEAGKTIEVKLSDLLYDINLVKLELNEEFPISEQMKQWVGGKHILIITRTNVLQYTCEGKFVRELITNGSGPEEFDEVDYFDIDEKKDVFYFFDHGSAGKIRSVDLKTGEFLEDILLPDDERWLLADFIVYEDKLLCFTNNFSAVDYRYFTLDDYGHVEYGCRKQAYLKDRPQVSISPYLSEIGGRVNYKQVRDTLFFLDKDTLAIELIIRENNYFSPGDNRNRGFSPWIHLNGVTYLLIKNTELEFLQMEGGGIGIKDHGSRNILINREEETMAEVSDFYIDYLGVKREEVDFSFNDNKAWIVIDAVELLKIIKEALDNKDIDPKVRSRLLALQDKLNENDNPYLLIGSMK